MVPKKIVLLRVDEQSSICSTIARPTKSTTTSNGLADASVITPTRSGPYSLSGEVCAILNNDPSFARGSAIMFSADPVYHPRSRHVQRRVITLARSETPPVAAVAATRAVRVVLSLAVAIAIAAALARLL